MDESARRTQDDHAGRAISTLLILCPAELNHILGRRMSDVDLAKNRISVICEAEEREKFRRFPSKSFEGEALTRCLPWDRGSS
jgi:hypothetical protein